MNIRMIIKIVGTIFSIMFFVFLCGVVASLVLGDSPRPFALSAGVSAACALLLNFFTRRGVSEVSKKDAYLSVVISWLSISLVGMMPFLFFLPDISFVDAFFESVSGFTTTGISVLPAAVVERLPRSFLFWRCFANWIGGIGVIMIVIVILPSLNAGGYRLFSLESSMQQKVLPSIRKIASRFLFIYLCMTIVGVLLLCWAGNGVFASACLAFSTISTGACSDLSRLGAFSPHSQYVLMLLMLCGGTTFGVFYALAKGRFRQVWRNEEFWAYLKTVAFFGLLVSAFFLLKTENSLPDSLRTGFFSVVSVVSCTGFSAGDVSAYPVAVVTILFFLMFVGGCAGSTSGGIKIFRLVIFFKNLRLVMDSFLHPNYIRRVKFNGRILDDTVNVSILMYIFLYIFSVIVGSLVLVFLGVGGNEAFSAVAMAISSLGSAVGDVSLYSPAVKAILCFFMILGRLEIYPLLILLFPVFWRRV